MNRKTRESRSELRRFMRNIKRANPSVNCVLQYDKLVVDHKIFVWNDIQVRPMASWSSQCYDSAGQSDIAGWCW